LLVGALRERGVCNAIACRPKAPLEARARAAGVPTLPLAGGSLRALGDVVRAARGFDLLHCHTARAHSLVTLAAPALRQPVVVTRRVDFRPSQSRFNRWKYRRAARVICISEFIARQLEQWGVSRHKLIVIPSAVPMPSSSDAAVRRAQEWRCQLNLSSDQKLVGNIAALVGHKDHATLLRAAREVAAQRKDIVFVIVGDGELRTDLEQLHRKLGLEGTVRFVGFLPQAEELLPAFDVFAMSSCMEGLGSIVLDAFAAGVPVAVTAGGGLPELVRDGQTGLLVPVSDASALANAIVRLLDQPDLAKKLIGNARAWVQENFSVPRMAESYWRVYQEILKPQN
jgi:glycosyltransferase involved in cell wall biosynthesis